MATARDKLVADWRHQLHAAQDALAESPGRAWFLEMRVRLYRFLLACYGKANWRTTPAPADQASGVVFDQPEAALLHGKPAKTAGKIQAFLKAVANAQGFTLAPGSLSGGLEDKSWIVVAAATAHVDTQRFVRLLKRRGIVARAVVRGDDELVEVALLDRQRANELLEQNRKRLLLKRNWSEARRMGPGLAILSSLFAGAFLATAVFLGVVLSLPEPQLPLSDFALGFLFCGCWAGVIILVSLTALLRPVRAFFANFDERGCWNPEVHGFPRDDE